MQIYGKNVAREKLQTKDKIKKVYLSNKLTEINVILLMLVNTSLSDKCQLALYIK